MKRRRDFSEVTYITFRRDRFNSAGGMMEMYDDKAQLWCAITIVEDRDVFLEKVIRLAAQAIDDKGGIEWERCEVLIVRKDGTA